MNKTLRWILNIIVIGSMIYIGYPVLEWLGSAIQNKIIYTQAENELRYTNEYDWIEITNTNINYPIAYKENSNHYYLKHDIYGNENIHGAIFYDGSSEPYSSHTTIIYGHCMKDGSMFNNLHRFKNSEIKFRESELMVERKDGTTKYYQPLGVYVTNSDFFYMNLSKMEREEAIALIKEKSVYSDTGAMITEDSEIICLMTCSYDNEGDKLFVFYVSE